jgi:hypothetical protein
MYTCKNIHAYVRKPTDPRGMIVALLYMPSIKLSIRSPVCSKSWSLNGEKQRKARRIGLNRGMDVCLFTLPLVGHDTQLNLINMYIYIIMSIFAIHVNTMYIYIYVLSSIFVSSSYGLETEMVFPLNRIHRLNHLPTTQIKLFQLRDDARPSFPVPGSSVMMGICPPTVAS